MSHSKRNTSRAVFTSHERSLAKAAWSQSSARLTRESFLPFASCALCLEPAQDPVACAAAGDIFCRECALANILAQKQELRRLDKLRVLEEREEAERRRREEAEDQARVVQEFELVQAGMEGKGKGSSKDSDKKTAEVPSSSSSSSSADPTRKRKFADELERVAEEDRHRARRAIEADRAAAHDARALPSFWTPSETPGADMKNKNDKNDKQATTRHPVCPAGRDGHTYSLHSLVTVHFTLDAAGQRTCPACSKVLSNASKAVLAKPCGHVLCRSCVHQFVQPPTGGAGALFDPHAPPGTTGRVRCYVCEADLEGVDGKEKKTKKSKEKEKEGKKEKKEKEHITPGLVEIRSEGTGFSAGGASQVKKSGIAFQC